MKISKKLIAVVILALVLVMAMSICVNASTNSDVISYISKAHTVNGRTLQLNSTQRQSLTAYLNENPVSDSEADEIIAKLDSAKEKIAATGATGLSGLSESVKSEVMSLVKEAGSIAGLDVQIDTVNETVTVKDSNGNVIISATSYSSLNSVSSSSGSSDKLVYTGTNIPAGAVIITIAIVAIAVVGLGIRKVYAK